MHRFEGAALRNMCIALMDNGWDTTRSRGLSVVPLRGPQGSFILLKEIPLGSVAGSGFYCMGPSWASLWSNCIWTNTVGRIISSTFLSRNIVSDVCLI